MTFSDQAIKAKTTIIVPYHFREELESEWFTSLGKDPSVFTDAEPHTMSLARAWAQRVTPVPSPQSETHAFPNEPEIVSKVREKLQGISYHYKSEANSDELKSIKAELIKGLSDKEIEGLGFDIKKGGAHKVFESLVSNHVRFVEPFWETLRNVSLELEGKDSYQEASQLISLMKELIDKDIKTNMVGNGMSAALKRLWSVERNDHQGSRQSNDLAHPLANRCLVLSASDALKNLWGEDAIFRIKRGKDNLGTVKLERLLNVFCHKNNGFLCFTFELIDVQDVELLQKSVFGLVRSRNECQLEVENSFERPIWHEELLPNNLRGASFDLRDLSQWLISLSTQEAIQKSGPRRLGELRKWLHHTSVHLPRKLEQGELEELRQNCWMLARAVGTKRKAPPLSEEFNDQGSTMLYDDTLVESSVEGSCVFTWQSETGTFDSERWALENFQGIYMILHLHIRGEEAGLQDFSHQSLKLIRELSPLTHHESGDLKHRHTQLTKTIKKLKKLILEMVYFNISFNSASAGGYSDHMSFLDKLREVHSLDQLRDELKTNISELNELVDRFEAELRDAQATVRDEDERLFNRNMSILGAIAVPFGLLSGLMGMNTFDAELTPMTQMGFWSVVIASVLLSGLIVLLINRGYSKSER